MPAKRVTSRNPWHLVFILDDSISMQGTRAAQVNEVMEEFLDELGLTSMGMKPYFRVSIIVFGSAVEVSCEAVPECDLQPDSLVRLTGARGTTNAASALDEARALLKRNPGKETDFRPFVWFMTDGQPDDKALALEAAAALRALDIPAGSPWVFSVGYGATDHDFMRELATNPEFYTQLTDLKQLKNYWPNIGTVVTAPPMGSDDGSHEMARRMAQASAPRVVDV